MTNYLKYITAILSLIFHQAVWGQKTTTDTTYLLKEQEHIIFIDNSTTSKFYYHVANFKFSKYDKDCYTRSLQYLKDRGVKLKKTDIKDIPQKWIVLKYYKNKFFTYHPSDFYTHLKISITDTAFIDHGGEGPIANKIVSFKKLNDQTFSFTLTGELIAKRELVIHIIDKQKGIAIFETHIGPQNKQYFLMIEAKKIRQLPIIVNYCKTQKQMEFDFDDPDFKKLLAIK
jgi:hypothetical protein